MKRWKERHFIRIRLDLYWTQRLKPALHLASCSWLVANHQDSYPSRIDNTSVSILGEVGWGHFNLHRTYSLMLDDEWHLLCMYACMCAKLCISHLSWVFQPCHLVSTTRLPETKQSPMKDESGWTRMNLGLLRDLWVLYWCISKRLGWDRKFELRCESFWWVS